MREGNKHPAPEVQAPGRDKDGFPIKEVEEIKRLGAQRVESPQGVYYRIPMQALYPENSNMSELDYMNFFPTEEPCCLRICSAQT